MADSVLPIQGHKNVGQMNAIGYVVAGGIALVLLPVLPLLAALYLLGQYDDRQQEVTYAGSGD